ncbi:MAG: site-specific DNA-methyltransferase [Ruminococcus sp.]|nr:site-specific DNA-methyltransferase [Ruminococcus sp.]
MPYNTGNDSFGYNDKFNHSSWLTFMKNRLEIAHSLLSNDDTIAISVDNYEIAYLLVLLDEIFRKENRKNIITVKRASASGPKVINPGVVNIVEYVILYAKDTSFWNPNRVYAAKGYDSRYNVWINNAEKDHSEWTFSTVLEKWAEYEGVKKSALKKKYGENYESALTNFVIGNADKIGRWAALDNNSIGEEAKKAKQESLDNPDKVVYLPREGAKDYYIRNGNALLFASDRLLNIDGQLTLGQPICDIWDDVLPNDLHNEGNVGFKKGKKPEKLISRIIELCTNKGDLIVDFFAGSGTTGAAALKMGRRFILCEQMDYIEDITVARLDNVINGESRGISSDAGWQGGGSFIYCELAKLNQTYVDQIAEAKDDAALATILEDILKTGFISYTVDPTKIDPNSKDFAALSLKDKKTLLMELIDKNQLYVNYCDIDDETFAVSESDKSFTRSFYGEDQ